MTEITAKLSTALAGRYRIERRLGEGGMATVYLAEDLKHKRKVAVKVLRPELAAVLGAERFVQEITTTANLQHPHILQLYDSGEADSFLYYVMPYVEGESLREKLNREKQLSIEETVEITKVIASALDFAHKRDIIHRDIKPENILLQDGVALVADFGIAVALSSVGGDRLTETGLSLGTPAYMSPEQVAGERDLDARSDVYSLACVTYEMLAGDPPFIASTAQAVMAKHVTDPAAPITTTRPSVGPSIAHALAKALNKAPVDRYESPGAFATGLTSEQATSKSPATSILVLPFANVSPDPDNEYFADGLTEEIIGDLSRLQGLRVISRNSAMQLKGTTKDTKAIGRELDVQYVLEGSVRRAADNLRISAQLIDATTDGQVWADRYSGTLEDVFGMQEEVSSAIVKALKLRLTPDEERQLAARPINDPRAYDAWLLAMHEGRSFTKEGIDRAIQHAEQALSIVGDNALLYAALGFFYWGSYDFGVSHDAETLLRAETCATKALELDGELSQAHHAMGLVRYKRGDVPGFIRYARQAVELDRDSDALSMLAFVLAEVGNTADARSYAEQALAKDPLVFFTSFARASVDIFDGHFDAALVRLRDAVERLAPGQPFATWWLAQAAAFAGKEEEAQMQFDHVAKMDAGLWSDLSEFFGMALRGDCKGVRNALDNTELREMARTDEYYPTFLAAGLTRVGETDEALDWLEQAISWGFTNHRFLSHHDRFLEPLRSDVRFEALMERARKNTDALEV